MTKGFVGMMCVVAIIGIGASFARADIATTIDSRRAELQAELVELEKEIDAQRGVLEAKQRERVSFERDVAILDAQIERARLSIRARDITIQQLGSEIGGKERVIGSLLDKMEREKRSLAQLIRKKYELDSYSFVEVILGKRNISDMFSDVDSFEFIGRALRESMSEIILTKDTTEIEKSALEEKQSEELELRKIQELQKNRIEEREREKQGILDATLGEEARYQTVLKAQEKSAAQIRAELFSLRDTAAIPFEEALVLATRTFEKTGVRPALILGIIAEESNLGENVGQCFLTNSPNKGDGVGKNTGRSFREVMKPSRDVDLFIEITRNLGIDPFRQVVSCPPGYGYGGAMGPAQFIPSTWVLFEDAVARLTGHNPPNPWDPEDAFMASSLLLRDNGAAKGTHAAERLAALRYLAGWKNATKPAYAFYGDDVMALAAKYQKMIDTLQGN